MVITVSITVNFGNQSLNRSVTYRFDIQKESCIKFIEDKGKRAGTESTVNTIS
jgi:hypothetical protein